MQRETWKRLQVSFSVRTSGLPTWIFPTPKCDVQYPQCPAFVKALAALRHACGSILKILKNLCFFFSLSKLKITVCKHLYETALGEIMVGIVLLSRAAVTMFQQWDQTLPTGNTKSIASPGGGSKCEFTTDTFCFWDDLKPVAVIWKEFL